ncbi:MAG: zinc-binding dehydrogenase [Flavobacteriales bacterium]
MQTEAFVLTQVGAAHHAFTRQKTEVQEPKIGEVLIESEAFGLNYADVMARLGLYREAPPMPCVIGYELVGKIIQVGENVSQDWLGKRVLAFTRFGAYARHALTTIDAVQEIPLNLAASDALPFATQGVTAYYMTHVLAPVQAHDHVLVHAAAGGVGSFLIQLAKLKGATVFANTSSDQKFAYVKSLGADHVVNYKKEPYQAQISQLLGPQKLQVAYNPVAGKTTKTDLNLLGPGGRLFLFGGSDLAQRKGLFGKLKFLWEMGMILPIGLMMRSKNILGVNMLKLAESQPLLIQKTMADLLALYEQKQLKLPEIKKYSAHEFFEAHDALGAGTTTGKLVIIWD